MAGLLIPRAVAYPAGLLDFFFRGRMEIALPDAGFYGIEDHARFASQAGTTATDPMTHFRGFGKLKLKLRNATADIAPPNGVPTAQSMSGGSLFAVAKFNRNRCYDDLLANWPLDRQGAQGCRVVTQEIVVSDPQVASVPPATAANPDGEEFAFTFSDRQIPINAWNVVLQVVYRGRLGNEDDAVVVATKDLSEPTFVSFQNATDYVLLDGKLYTPADLRDNHQALLRREADVSRRETRQLRGVAGALPLQRSSVFSAGGRERRRDLDGAGALPPRRSGVSGALLTSRRGPGSALDGPRELLGLPLQSVRTGAGSVATRCAVGGALYAAGCRARCSELEHGARRCGHRKHAHLAWDGESASTRCTRCGREGAASSW